MGVLFVKNTLTNKWLFKFDNALLLIMKFYCLNSLRIQHNVEKKQIQYKNIKF